MGSNPLLMTDGYGSSLVCGSTPRRPTLTTSECAKAQATTPMLPDVPRDPFLYPIFNGHLGNCRSDSRHFILREQS